MILRFNITMEDLVAFNRYHFRHSPYMQWIGYGGMFVVAALIVAGFSVAAVGSGESGVALLGVLVAVLFCVIWRWFWPRSLDRQVRRLYGEGKNQGLGAHELEIDPNGIAERTDVSESRQAWRGVDRIVETEDYAFIYISALMAHVIPKHRTTAGDPQAFVARARQWWQEANR